MCRKLAIFVMIAFCVWVSPSASYAVERVFDLTIDEVAINVAADLKYKVFAFNRQVPGPLIELMGWTAPTPRHQSAIWWSC